MGKLRITNEKEDLQYLCNIVRELISTREYKKCQKKIVEAMYKYPHAPQPHNLLGLLLEVQKDHLTAMKHFAAAWALDPTYLPSRHNLEHYGTFFSHGRCAYDESDCFEEEMSLHKNDVSYDTFYMDHLVRREKK